VRKADWNPNLFANYNDVDLSKINPPKIIPVDWQAAWITLIILVFLSYFKQSASSDISCKLTPINKNISRIAKSSAWF
jgi:hypothetical protein